MKIQTNRLMRLTLILLLVGAVIAGVWMGAVGAAEYFKTLTATNPWLLVPLVALTGMCICIRFIRWQFLLRRVNVRLPARSSLSMYLASLVGIATPGYLGELTRCMLIRRRFGTPVRITASVLVSERLMDVVALCLLAWLTSTHSWISAVMLVLASIALAMGWIGIRIVPWLGVPPALLTALSRPYTLVISFMLSLVAWLLAGMLFVVASHGQDTQVGPVHGVAVFSMATMLGSLTFMPAGVGATGSIAIINFGHLGLGFVDAVTLVSLVRLATVGFALLLGCTFCVVELRSLRKRMNIDSNTHFDSITKEYADQFSDHMWAYLLERKISLITDHLHPPTKQPQLGLDLGCGLGKQCLAMNENGYHVIGLEPTNGLAHAARQAGATVVCGDACRIPFDDGSLDFVYTVGVLHHLANAEQQHATCREVWRVLKTNGLFFVHETNPRNPVFRFYMGYVFPVIKTIDIGTEWWIDPHRWTSVAGLTLLDLKHFTFVPDFLPRWLLRPFTLIERRLESSALSCYSAHYLAVLKKDNDHT